MVTSKLNYPLTATFRIVTLSPELQVKNASGDLVLQIKQKLLTLREDTTAYEDVNKTVPLYRMKADRISGFWAVHNFWRSKGETYLGSIRANGLRSIWRISYTVTDQNQKEIFRIREENPWIKLLDGLLCEIDGIGWIFGMFINPVYLVEDVSGRVLFRIKKKRSFWERSFTMEAEQKVSEEHQELAVLALAQSVLLERARG
ncbi:hypothetical protein [Deinococcus cellulosilyticus]|uniref:Uncharacterized protein n=1 Tax=Deinococcus cellulosilyticus (strain DSM 18568 / NBRC 106333 / KACC 11606 / 5516J-15) TaxID=1223518 RepID=A0A511N6P1_DEIC1|nr:hypothetical protein [Deinococcus cellulosilyticus]GEM48532.1 hypothetical protein DC3_41670 [Deinococcus cellulosilyticus NBRC 106333 = KACC 11606]